MANTGPSNEVKILDVKSRQTKVIHPKLAQVALTSIDWSADGKAYYVSATSPSGENKLLRMDADGNTQPLLPTFNTWVGELMTSPDGKHLAYAQDVQESNITLLENF